MPTMGPPNAISTKAFTSGITQHRPVEITDMTRIIRWNSCLKIIACRY